MDVLKLQKEWQAAKLAEREAADRRRAIEDELSKHFGITGDEEGTKTYEGFKVTCRMNRKIDAEKLQEIAAENGLSVHLSSLFRWKPDINMTAWKAASEEVTKPLLGAITTTPGRPSFAIKETK